ncbi:MAG: hypothetical protein QW607_06760 [Desulfurococcaceae archaeon]
MTQDSSNPQGDKKPIPPELIEGSAVLGIRVSLSHYTIYKKYMTGVEQSRIREILRSTFEQLVENREILSSGSNQPREINVPVKINLFEKVEDSEVLKIKKKIDKYQRELAVCTNENISLRDENESLKNKIKELETHLQQIQQIQTQTQREKQLDEKLRKAVSYLQLSHICLSNIDICNIDAVLRNIDIIINENKEYTEPRERIEQRFRSLYTRKT